MVGFSFRVQFKSFPAMKNVMAQLFDETGFKEQGFRSQFFILCTSIFKTELTCLRKKFISFLIIYICCPR
jgi:hypothetical protein